MIGLRGSGNELLAHTIFGEQRERERLRKRRLAHEGGRQQRWEEEGKRAYLLHILSYQLLFKKRVISSCTTSSPSVEHARPVSAVIDFRKSTATSCHVTSRHVPSCHVTSGCHIAADLACDSPSLLVIK